MKKLHFKYDMQLDFQGGEVEGHSFVLRCLPKQNACQHITRLSFQVDPVPSLTKATDCFGNILCYGHIEEPHSDFSFSVSGIAITNSENIDMSPLHPLYRYSTPQTTLTSGMEPYLELATHMRDPIQKALAMSAELYRNFVYKSGTTNTSTTAQQALNQGYGVCQDYSHILIAMCRMIGIPARYAAGFMYGEGATHAWVEIYARGHWIGIDPTNNRVVDDKYVKLSEGRDAGDCIIDKGVFFGAVNQIQTVNVRVSEEKM